MLHLITHVTTDTEIAQLPRIEHALERCFPAARQLHIMNQTSTELTDSYVCENIKHAGFGWTLRFLRYARTFMTPEDLLVKIDPDIEIRGYPLRDMSIPQGACFGQMKLVQGVPVLLGGFQGFTFDAVDLFLSNGWRYENQPGKQDPLLYRLGADLGMNFLALPWVDLWADRNNYDPNSCILSWKRR